ncbi:MAG: ATP-binding protein, partial [Gammaproteobacteria bacterium]|nr:ATP-binding protein [Gammaproteobacteria bacterium]
DRTLDLPTDLAFAGEAWTWVEDARPLVTADSALDPHELAGLLYDAYFSPSDDADADSWERQRIEFEREALHLATRLLVSDDEARRRSIADAVERELFWLIPRERGADIAVRNGRVTVTLGEPAAEAAS